MNPGGPIEPGRLWEGDLGLDFWLLQLLGSVVLGLFVVGSLGVGHGPLFEMEPEISQSWAAVVEALRAVSGLVEPLLGRDLLNIVRQATQFQIGFHLVPLICRPVHSVAGSKLDFKFEYLILVFNIQNSKFRIIQWVYFIIYISQKIFTYIT